MQVLLTFSKCDTTWANQFFDGERKREREAHNWSKPQGIHWSMVYPWPLGAAHLERFGACAGQAWPSSGDLTVNLPSGFNVLAPREKIPIFLW